MAISPAARLAALAATGSLASLGSLTLAFAFAAVEPDSAQTPRATIVGLAGIPRLLDPQLSPDGATVLYLLNRADWKANRAVGHIWRQPVGGGAPTQMTTGDGGSTPRWSPDGASFLYVARGADGTSQIFVMPAAGGAATAVTRHATSVSQPAWAPDGAFIYFLASDARSEEARARDRLRDDVFVFDRTFTHRHLWRVRIATGAEEKLTDGELSTTAYRLSRDGRFLVMHRAPTPLPGDSHRSEIWLADAGGGQGRALTDNLVEEAEAQLSPDNGRVLFIAEAAVVDGRLEPYYSSKLFTVPAAGGRVRPLASAPGPAIERAAWAPDGHSALGVANMGVHSQIVRIDVPRVPRAPSATGGGKSVPLTEGRHSVQFWSAAPDGAMIFQIDEPARPGDAWILRPGASAPVRVTGIYDTLATDMRLPRQEKVTWRGADGTPIEGILFYPDGYSPGSRHPLIVQLHGGPAESDKFGFGPGVIVNYVPVLTGLGYGVLRPNYRGSAGYGDAFLRDVIPGFFRNMHQDVLAGVDHLVREGIADPGRLGVMGWSAGGHLTNKLITVTDRFKAASSSAGAANWASFFAQTDTRASRAIWFGGTPWGANARTEMFWNSSPVKDAFKVRTPTLLFAGQEDARVPVAQSIEMYRALVANGVETRLYVAPREGHQWGELRHQLFKANAELEWFERHVRGRRYVWEEAPEGS
jgi:dipeptidyl aminopeptidase/acylaminoacyl peptidase